MNRYLFLFVISVIYLICSARSCNDRDDVAAVEQRSLSLVRDSVKNESGVEFLSDEAIRGLEVTAGEKLRDLADYLQIVNDTNADPVFRKKAAVMVSTLFISGNPRICLNFNQDRSGILLPKLLQDGMDGKQPQAELLISSVQTINPLKRTNDTIYSGQIRFVQTNRFAAGRSAEIERRAQMFSVRSRKVFGSDTLLVWKVVLGNIE